MSHLRKNQSVEDTREKIFRLVKTSIFTDPNESASCTELFMDTSELLTDACD